MNKECMITEQDVAQIAGQFRTREVGEQLVELYGREPNLMIAMTETWTRITHTIDRLGLSEADKLSIRKEVIRHTATGLILIDRGHRRLWADMLPEDYTEGAEHAG